MSFPVIIKETTGPGRAIVLRGRSLPYREVSWGGTQRVNINYFPGNPVASGQVIGPTYKPTVFRGKWKDAFLNSGPPASPGFLPYQVSRAENSPLLLNFPNITPFALADIGPVGGNTFVSAGGVPGSNQKAVRARIVRDAFELIRRSGQLLRVEWGSIVRFGFLTETDFIHDREEDIAFEMQFSWTGDSDAPPRLRLLPFLDPLGLLKQLAKILQALLDVLLVALVTVEFAIRNVTQLIRRLGGLVTGLLDLLRRFASLLLVPAELLGTIRQQLTSIALAAKDLVTQLRGTPAAYKAAAEGAGASAANIAQLLVSAITFNALQLGAISIQQRREIERLQDSNLLGVFVSPGGTTLRDASTRFYGTPDNWGVIQAFNGFAGSVVPRGTVVRVPRLPTQV